MRILILTQYYPPETGAPQNRLSGLAKELIRLGHSIEVLTAMPNYPAMEIHPAYRGKWYAFEYMEEIPVHRAWIYVSKSRSVISRLLNYFSFVFSSIAVAGKIKGQFDVVLCESPPLFLGISGWWISRRKKAQLVFNVSDLWPESAEKLGVIRNKQALKLAGLLEEWLYRKSMLVSGQTQGIVNDIRSRIPGKPVYWLPNGVDQTLFSASITPGWRRENGFGDSDFLVLYAGIIGLAQGLDTVLDAAQLLPKDSVVRFVLLGDGPEKERLVKRVNDEHIPNVTFPSPVGRDRMPSVVTACDAAVIPLKKMDLFMGAIPSKIFENLALGKPIILGVDGEARDLFINQQPCGVFVEPENASELAIAAHQLSLDPDRCASFGRNGVQVIKEHFLRSAIASGFAAEVKRCLSNTFDKPV